MSSSVLQGSGRGGQKAPVTADDQGADAGQAGPGRRRLADLRESHRARGTRGRPGPPLAAGGGAEVPLPGLGDVTESAGSSAADRVRAAFVAAGSRGVRPGVKAGRRRS